MSEEAASEDVVAKYKRLLSLARSSLEANQATLITKDQQITQLVAALEAEKSQRATKHHSTKEDESSLIPRRILCRVDVEEIIWILIEYDDHDDMWKMFESEQSLDDFIQRVPGVPLHCPPKNLSVEESSRIIDESKRKVERIVEEFRRYKVRTEIARKQKDAETKQSLLVPPSLQTPHLSLNSSLDKALTHGAMNDLDHHSDELQRLKSQMNEQEVKWKQTYEKILKENEVLKSKGGESVIAAQWRSRYETCLREKEDALEKLKVFTKVVNDVEGSGKTLEQAFIDLQDDYKNFRRKVFLSEKQRYQSRETSSLPSELQMNFDEDVDVFENRILINNNVLRFGRSAHSTNSLSSHMSYGSGGGESPRDSLGGSGGGGMNESKITYVRHMIFQYLICKEPEVKSHMETALMAIFRMTDDERRIIEMKRFEDTQDTLSSISNFLGSLATT